MVGYMHERVEEWKAPCFPFEKMLGLMISILHIYIKVEHHAGISFVWYLIRFHR